MLRSCTNLPETAVLGAQVADVAFEVGTGGGVDAGDRAFIPAFGLPQVDHMVDGELDFLEARFLERKQKRLGFVEQLLGGKLDLPQRNRVDPHVQNLFMGLGLAVEQAELALWRAGQFSLELGGKVYVIEEHAACAGQHLFGDRDNPEHLGRGQVDLPGITDHLNTVLGAYDLQMFPAVVKRDEFPAEFHAFVLLGNRDGAALHRAVIQRFDDAGKFRITFAIAQGRFLLFMTKSGRRLPR